MAPHSNPFLGWAGKWLFNTYRPPLKEKVYKTLENIWLYQLFIMDSPEKSVFLYYIGDGSLKRGVKNETTPLPLEYFLAPGPPVESIPWVGLDPSFKSPLDSALFSVFIDAWVL